MSDEEFDKLEVLTRRTRLFIQGFTSMVDPGYEVSRKGNMITFMVLDGVTNLAGFSAIIVLEGEDIVLTVRPRKAYEDLRIGRFEPSYENGVNAWKLVQVQALM